MATREEAHAKLKELAAQVPVPEDMESGAFQSALENVVYTMNERGLWEDGVELSAANVGKAWRMVEALRVALRSGPLPEELIM